MRLIIQRVSKASCIIDNIEESVIDKGYVVFLGVADSDNESIAEKMIDKLYKLRIFEDNNNKTNLSISQVNGEIMVISQFTLYANCKKGNRPSFTDAGSFNKANYLYEYFIDKLKDKDLIVKSGRFGADMSINLVNEGPFTIYLDSEELFD